MKKLLALLLTLSMVFALAACGGNDNKPSDSSNTPTDTNTPAPDANTPAPEMHAPPTNVAPPAARAATLQPDNPETYTKAPTLDQPMALDRRNHPQTLRW